MFEIKGFIFKEVNNDVKTIPLQSGFRVTSYDEVHELMKQMGITHYMFLLKEVKN